MKQCAFLTLADSTGFYIYDQLVFEPLQKLGWTVTEVVWNSKEVDWNQFDAVVIRSTWDYQDNVEAFFETLESIHLSKANLFNSIDVCRWNFKKSYLRELQAADIPIVPSHWPGVLSREALTSSFDLFGVKKLVVKPIVGANADHIFVLKQDQPTHWFQALNFYSNRDCIVQPFLNSICEIGEYSLFYFDRDFSHAIIKRPALGDFRVQEEHGGSIKSVHVDATFHSVAEDALEFIGDPLLYARIDLVLTQENSPSVMEIELIEPSLYFNYDERAPAKFANALEKVFQSVTARS